jgi:DNA-binding response OmpR family regulator
MTLYHGKASLLQQIFSFESILLTRMKLLVIEDDHHIARALKKGFEQERFTVDLAFTGTDGFDLASMDGYDIIICDLMLPGMDGLTLTKRLREKHIHTPILILTAKGTVSDKVSGFDSGADDYVTKPFSFEELLARVRAIVRRPKDVVTEKLVVHDLILHRKTFEVYRGKTKIQLSGKEFSLLEYFMRHPKEICTKESLITHVWDYDADILPNTVEVYMRNLRNKIDHPFPGKKPLFQTVRGFGYKLGL